MSVAQITSISKGFLMPFLSEKGGSAKKATPLEPVILGNQNRPF